MRLTRASLAAGAAALIIVSVTFATAPSPASAALPGGLCTAAGDASRIAGKACDLLRNPKQLLSVGKNLVTGHIGTAINDLLGNGNSASASTALSLAAIVAWVSGGARAALHEMSKFVSETAAPQLGTVWFSSTYWRIAGVGALLTVPFLFAAAVQALVRSDLALLGRAAFGHLPLALVGVGIAAPITMLLLSGTDDLCSLVWSRSSTDAFVHSAEVAGVISLLRAPFLAFLLFLFTAAGALLVWLELAMREAAVYIVVLLLPLAFAALVWPARRVWALRAVELLVALILSKFAIVAVLGLGGEALDHASASGVGLGTVLAGMVLVLLAALAPWAVLRLVPLTELASSAAGALRPHAMASVQATKEVKGHAEAAIGGVAGHLVDLATFSTERARVHQPDLNGRGGERPRDRVQSGRVDLDNRRLDALAGMRAEESQGNGLADGVGGDADAADAADGVAGLDAAAHGGQGGRESVARDQRVPGADPIWQAPDMSWPPLTLGVDEGWPPEPPWPDGGRPPGDPIGPGRAEGAPRDQPDPPTPPADGAPRDQPDPLTPAADGGPGEQSDPLPPAQDRGGPL